MRLLPHDSLRVNNALFAKGRNSSSSRTRVDVVIHVCIHEDDDDD